MTENVEQLSQFFLEALRLKRLPRNGWLYSGISKSEVESVADHSYSMILITLILGLKEQQINESFDLEKALIMAIIHDLSEAISQDIDRRVGKFAPDIFEQFKKQLDSEAFQKITAFLPEKIKEKLVDIYLDFLERKSPEAILVKEADRLETILQLYHYRMTGKPKSMFKEFYQNFSKEIDTYESSLIKSLVQLILSKNPE
ncbi:MAG: HD family hydrolase [Asgard group archaeon]|nr:HD family hydrolase [Asgard group archaeon]